MNAWESGLIVRAVYGTMMFAGVGALIGIVAAAIVASHGPRSGSAYLRAVEMAGRENGWDPEDDLDVGGEGRDVGRAA